MLNSISVIVCVYLKVFFPILFGQVDVWHNTLEGSCVWFVMDAIELFL